MKTLLLIFIFLLGTIGDSFSDQVAVRKIFTGDVNIIGRSFGNDSALFNTPKGIRSYLVYSNAWFKNDQLADWSPFLSKGGFPMSVGYSPVYRGDQLGLSEVGAKVSLKKLRVSNPPNRRNIVHVFYKWYPVIVCTDGVFLLRNGSKVRLRSAHNGGQPIGIDTSKNSAIVVYKEGVEIFDVRTGKSSTFVPSSRNLKGSVFRDGRTLILCTVDNAFYAYNMLSRRLVFLWKKGGAWRQSFSPSTKFSIFYLNLPDASHWTRGAISLNNTFDGKGLIDEVARLGRITECEMVGAKIYVVCSEYKSVNPQLVEISPPKALLSRLACRHAEGPCSRREWISTGFCR